MTFFEVLAVSLVDFSLADMPNSPPALAVHPQRDPEL